MWCMNIIKVFQIFHNRLDGFYANEGTSPREIKIVSLLGTFVIPSSSVQMCY